MTVITGSELVQSGRATAFDPTLDNVTVGARLDMSAGAENTFEFGSVNNQQTFGVPRTIFVDNGTGPNPITVKVSITGQEFDVPPYAQGYFPLNATDKSAVTVSGDGGNTKPSTVTVFNHEKPASVWYAPGNNNPLAANSVQGPMQEGADIASQGSKNPVYVGGIDRASGLFHAMSVDATGVLDVTINGTVPVSIADVAVNNFPTNQGNFTDESIANLSGASEMLLAANADRRVLVINNPNAANPIAVNLTGAAAALNSAGSITILASETLRFDGFSPTNAITVIGTAADKVTAYEGI